MDFNKEKNDDEIKTEDENIDKSNTNSVNDANKNLDDKAAKKLDKDEEYKKKIMDLFNSVDEENFDMDEFMKNLTQIGKERSKVKFYGRGLGYNIVRFLISFVLLFACSGFLSSFIEITNWYNALIYTAAASGVITIINVLFRNIAFYKINIFILIFIKYILVIVIAIIINIFANIGFHFDKIITIICYYLIYYVLSAILGLLIYKNNFLLKIR